MMMGHHVNVRAIQFLHRFSVDGLGFVAHQRPIQARHPVNEAGNETNIMRYDHNGHSHIELLKKVEDLRLNSGINIRCRFIQ